MRQLCGCTLRNDPVCALFICYLFLKSPLFFFPLLHALHSTHDALILSPSFFCRCLLIVFPIAAVFFFFHCCWFPFHQFTDLFFLPFIFFFFPFRPNPYLCWSSLCSFWFFCFLLLSSSLLLLLLLVCCWQHFLCIFVAFYCSFLSFPLFSKPVVVAVYVCFFFFWWWWSSCPRPFCVPFCFFFALFASSPVSLSLYTAASSGFHAFILFCWILFSYSSSVRSRAMGLSYHYFRVVVVVVFLTATAVAVALLEIFNILDKFVQLQGIQAHRHTHRQTDRKKKNEIAPTTTT